jgi:hypothetical protein
MNGASASLVRDLVDAILAMGDADPEHRHAREDALAEDFIRGLAPHNPGARELVRMFDAKRTRWYA